MTDDLIKQWAEAAGFQVSAHFGPVVGSTPIGDRLAAFASLAMAHQAEVDAAVLDSAAARLARAAPDACWLLESLSADIRASAPKPESKGTTS